jgi:molecular chaperone DnaJ
MKYHPDRNPGPDGEAKFKEASEAAEILLDDQKSQLAMINLVMQGLMVKQVDLGGGFQGDFGDLR